MSRKTFIATASFAAYFAVLLFILSLVPHPRGKTPQAACTISADAPPPIKEVYVKLALEYGADNACRIISKSATACLNSSC